MGSTKVVTSKVIKPKWTVKITPQQRLIHEIFRHYGGPAAVAKLVKSKTGLDITRHNYTNWAIREAVPLENLLVIANLLKVSPYCLNYKGWSIMLQEKKPWKEVVEECTVLLPITRKGLLR